jgi:hypothetical protein
MRADISTGLVSDDKVVIDTHSLTVHHTSSRSYSHPFAAPGVAQALYESARELGQLTRNPNARVTSGNMYE